MRCRARVGLDLGQNLLEFFALPVTNIQRRLRSIGDDVRALASAQHRKIDGDATAAVREHAIDQRKLMHQFGGGIAAVLRCHAGVGRSTLDVQANAGRALAPDGQGIRRIAWFHIEFYVVLAGKTLDQLRRTGGAPFLAVID